MVQLSPMWTKSGSFKLSPSFRARANGFRPSAPKRAAGGHDLDADDDVAIRLHGLFDFVFVDEARIGKDAVAWPGYPA